MSKQDTQFINKFSVIIGVLAAVALVFFAVARSIGGRTEGREVLTETEYAKGVAARVAPFAAEAVAGQNNSALAMPTLAGTAPAGASAAGGGLPVPTSGKELFQQVCSACHGAGVAGAPKAGDKAAWARHVAKGLPTLYLHALHGFHGSSGIMPAKGGRPDLPDAVVEQAVNYMVSLVDPTLVKGKPK